MTRENAPDECLVVVFFSAIRHIPLLILVLFGVACATLDDGRKNSPHFRDGRFRNLDNDDGIEEKSFWTLLKWK